MMYKNCVAQKKTKKMTLCETPKKMPQSEARRDEEYADALTHRARLIADVKWYALNNTQPHMKYFSRNAIVPGSSTRSVVREPNDAMRS